MPKVLILLVLLTIDQVNNQLQYVTHFLTPNYGLSGFRTINPFSVVNPYVGSSAKEMQRMAQQMSSLVSTQLAKDIDDVIIGHNKRMTDISRQMTQLAKSVSELAQSLTSAAREMSDIVRDGQQRSKIRLREIHTTAVNMAELATRLTGCEGGKSGGKTEPNKVEKLTQKTDKEQNKEQNKD